MNSKGIMECLLSKSSTFVSNYGSRDAFFRTIQSIAKLLSLLNSADLSTKKRVLQRIVSLLGKSRKYFAIGNCVKELNVFVNTLNSSPVDID